MIIRNISLLLLLAGFLLVSCKSTQTGTKASRGNQKAGVDNAGVFIDANKEKLIGNYDEAQRLFKKALELDPNDAASMYELAKLYARQNKINESLEFSRASTETDPENVYYHLLYGSLLQSLEMYSEATKEYEKIVELKPNNPEYYNQLAVAYLYAGEPMEAVKVYDRIEERAGVTEEYSMKKQSIYIQEGKINKAVEEIEKLIEFFPNETKYYAILAETCLDNGMDDKALEAYNKITEIDPDNPYINISMADYYKKNGQMDKAFEKLQLGFANPNLDIDTKVQILIRYYTVNEIYDDFKHEAFSLSDLLISTHPNDPKAYSIQGDFLYQDKQFEKARDAFRKVIELDSSKYLVWEQLLFTESELQDNKAILQESKKTIELFPEQPIPYLFAGGAYYQEKNWDECIKVLENGLFYVVNNDALLAQFYAYLGDAYNQIGDDKKSDKSYDNVLTLNPDHDYVLNNYAYYLSLRGENLEKAAKMAKRATEITPNSSSNQDTYGWVLFKMGYYEEAKFWIEKAISNGAEDNAVILEHLGDVEWKMDNQERAVELWIKAKESGKGSDLLDKKVEEKTYHE
ncbi:MAG: tetratricopeptide repeat protein [Bacteroidales bacterium]|nr:tetratricopeptide repeat protein [Bacteroidales bacterium]MCF8403473.1 tetratricopeptide repeat protein [Bacteroidales bacterium]